jgi:hypothetical protein
MLSSPPPQTHMEHLFHIEFFANSLTTSHALAALGIAHSHLLSRLASLELTTLRKLALSEVEPRLVVQLGKFHSAFSGPNVV